MQQQMHSSSVSLHGFAIDIKNGHDLSNKIAYHVYLLKEHIGVAVTAIYFIKGLAPRLNTSVIRAYT